MDPFECHTFKEAIDHETGFTRSQPQGYYKLIKNIQRVGNLISKTKQELKRGPRQTAQITETTQRGKYSLKFVMLCGTEEAKLGDGKKSSFRKLIK